LSNGKTWPRKNSVRLVHGPALKIQHRQIEPSTSAAPAIPNEKLIPSLQQYCFNKRMVQALQRELGFGQLQYRSHQICFVQNFAQREGNQKLSIMQLSRAFGCQPTRIKQR
jgi:hypothetical protein